MAENPSDLVGQEFIFEYGVDRIMPPSEKTRGVFATEQRAYRRERVVRCRDCAHRYIERETFEAPVELCEKLCYMVEPDGFCAWGEPRKED